MGKVPRKQKGITIAEILVVLALLGILALLLTPALTTYFTQNELKSAAESLYNDILLARTSAIKQSTPTTLTFIAGPNWCYGISSGNIGCTCTSAASGSNCDLGITSSNDFPKTTLTSNFPGNSTQFDAARGAATNTGNVVFSATSGTESITVSINALGAAKTCSSTVGGYSPC